MVQAYLLIEIYLLLVTCQAKPRLKLDSRHLVYFCHFFFLPFHLIVSLRLIFHASLCPSLNATEISFPPTTITFWVFFPRPKQKNWRNLAKWATCCNIPIPTCKQTNTLMLTSLQGQHVSICFHANRQLVVASPCPIVCLLMTRIELAVAAACGVELMRLKFQCKTFQEKHIYLVQRWADGEWCLLRWSAVGRRMAWQPLAVTSQELRGVDWFIVTDASSSQS